MDYSPGKGLDDLYYQLGIARSRYETAVREENEARIRREEALLALVAAQERCRQAEKSSTWGPW